MASIPVRVDLETMKKIEYLSQIHGGLSYGNVIKMRFVGVEVPKKSRIRKSPAKLIAL